MCRGQPHRTAPLPQGPSGDWPSSSQHTPHSTLESRQDGLVWPKPPLSTATQVLQFQSSLQQHHPSSLEFLGYQCKICEEKRWVKAAGYISPAPEPIKKPMCYTFIVCTSEKVFKVIVMWLYDQGSYHNPKKLKKCRQNKWLKFSLSWGKGEEGREVGWFQAHGHGWITSYQTKASNSIGPLTSTWSRSTFKALKEVTPFMPFKEKLFFNII